MIKEEKGFTIPFGKQCVKLPSKCDIETAKVVSFRGRFRSTERDSGFGLARSPTRKAPRRFFSYLSRPSTLPTTFNSAIHRKDWHSTRRPGGMTYDI